MEAEKSAMTTIIGGAPTFLAMMELVSRVAPLSKPVLVIGERGTGKELVAARLHFLSGRWEQPFVKLNCASLTETLLDSELFGHEAGAFTGAIGRHIGRFERADQGTLFLDELATIPVRMQEKILRVIEYGEFERVGGSETVVTDVRIVGATNADLPRMAKRGEFRPDLLDRLAFDVIMVPPLRHRREDILELAQHFAVNITRELERPYFPGFTDEATKELLTYSWPGNVRGLKNVVERSVYRSLEPEDEISQIVFDPFSWPYDFETPEVQHQIQETETHTPEPQRTEAPKPTTEPVLPTNLKEAVGDLEIQLLDQAMTTARYSQKKAAKLLALSYHQLRALLKKHDLLAKYGRSRSKSNK